jgi:hypothetical protein
MKCIRFSMLVLTCAFMFCMSADAKTISDSDKAQKVFTSFYKAMGNPYNIGIPDASLQKKLRQYLSAELNKTIKEAAIIETECMAVYGKHNTQVISATPKGQAPEILKPPVVEGSIFVSQYEPPDSFGILSATPKNNKMILLIEYTAYDGSTSANYTWNNKATLIIENGSWKIDDFIDMDETGEKLETQSNSVKLFLKSLTSCKNDFKK